MLSKVIFTREHAPSQEILAQLRANGFSAEHLPLICCRAYPPSQEMADKCVQADWVFFTSAVAVDFFTRLYSMKDLKIATIGQQTSLAVISHGYQVDFEAQSSYAVDFTEEWLNLGLPQMTILLPQSRLANPVIAEKLKAKGHIVSAWALYDTVPDRQGQEKLANYSQKEALIWTFASPSAWASFSEKKPRLSGKQQIAVIGKSTARAVEEAGYAVDIMPDQPSIQAMVEAIIEKEVKND